MKERTPAATAKIFTILLFIVLLPALFYSAYEINTMSRSEEMVAALYLRQLDAILFSVNQFSWDVVFTWAGDINREINGKKFEELFRPDGRFQIALKEQRSVKLIILTDTALASIRTLSFGGEKRNPSPTQILAAFQNNREKIRRLQSYRKLQYRKIEPVPLSDSTQVILFMTSDRSGTPMLAGMILHELRFIQEVMQQKLREAAGEKLILSVTDRRTQSIVHGTEEIGSGKIIQQRKLWVFPAYQIGITLKGTSPEDLMQTRFQRNLLLIGLLDILLLAGAWFVFRTIKREIELVQLKSDFVSNVSHELRTPLALIRMFAETLHMKRVKTEKKKQEYYRTILLETERLTRLINNILNFSRMEANKKQYDFTNADINDIIRSVINVYEYELSEKGFEKVLVLAENLPLLNIDTEAMAETLHNLIDNAIKYSPGKKYLRIATSRKGDEVVVEIQDKGIGIEMQYHKKIFGKFFRVSSGLVHTTKGSGLGLSLVHHIVHAHGGSVSVNSTPGMGSTFTIRLSLQRAVQTR